MFKSSGSKALLTCYLMWHYASVDGIKAKGSPGLLLASKMRSKSDWLFLFSETEALYLVPQSLWQALVPVSAVSSKNSVLISAT